MKILLIIITFVLTLSTAIAQLQGQAKIDSLLKELPKMKEDTNGVDLLTLISFAYRNLDPDKGVFYGEKGLKLSNKIEWEFGQSTCYRSLGLNYLSKSNYPKALEQYHKALKIDEKINNKIGIAKNYDNIATVYSYTLKYDKALSYYLKALDINKKLNNKILISSNLLNIGSLYGQQYNYSLALEYFQKALVIDEEIRNLGGIIKDLANIGTIYATQKKYSKALLNLNKVLDYLNQVGNSRAKVTILGNIGHIYLRIALDSNSNNNENRLNSTLDKEVNLNKSIEYLNSAILLSKEIGDLDGIALALYHISNAYTEKGDYKKAFETYKEYKSIKDTIFSSENQTKIANLEAKRENELKEKEIEILKKEKENQKLQRYAMFGGIAGLGIIIGLILIQRRKSEKLLLNVLPANIAKRLKAKEHPIADHFDEASIMFIDLVEFTKMSSSANPKEIVALLNDIFTIFDKLADKHGLEKIKTIGDAYMAVAGIPEIQTDHAKRTAQMALDIKKEMKDFKTNDGTEIKFRIGIDCGAVVAGVIGEKKFIYDLWSDAVNTASRMESTGESGQIQITENFKSELEKFNGNWNFNLRGEFNIKGKGIMKTYFLKENNLGEL